jgi:hypothetical protein
VRQKVLARCRRRCAPATSCAGLRPVAGVALLPRDAAEALRAATTTRCSSTSSCGACSSPRRTASASARSSRRTRRTRTRTELTGDINYRKIAEYGSDSDPRAFNFDGEFNVANRGIIEFIEVLKLDVAFLYDLLGASAGAQDQAEEVRADGHRRGDHRAHQRARVQEAAEQRADGGVPRPHHQDRRALQPARCPTRSRSTRRTSTKHVPGKHIAPHTLEIAAMWAVLTRLEEPKKANLTLLQKLKLYNGKSLPGFTARQHPRTARRGAARGHGTASRRATSRTRSATRWCATCLKCINPFMVMNELEEGPRPPQPDQRRETQEALPRAAGVVREEYEEIIKNEVQRAISGRRGRDRGCAATTSTTSRPTRRTRRSRTRTRAATRSRTSGSCARSRRRSTSPRARKDDFRREIMNYIGALAVEGKHVRLQDQRAAAPRARTQAVRGPEGLDQADEPRVDRRRQGHAGEDRRRQAAPDRDFGYDESQRDRRAQLRRVDLRARRHQGRVRLRQSVRPPDRPGPHALPPDRPRQDQAEPEALRELGRADRQAGAALRHDPAAADHAAEVPLRREPEEGGRPGRRRTRPAGAGPDGDGQGRPARTKASTPSRSTCRSRTSPRSSAKNSSCRTSSRAGASRQRRRRPLHGHLARRPDVAAALQAHVPRGAEAADRVGHLRPGPSVGDPDPRGPALPCAADALDSSRRPAPRSST